MTTWDLCRGCFLLINLVILGKIWSSFRYRTTFCSSRKNGPACWKLEIMIMRNEIDRFEEAA